MKVLTITIIIPDYRTYRGHYHYEMTGGVCQYVCLSVACLDLTRERKGLALLEVKRSRSPGRLMLSQTMHHTQVCQVGGFFLKLACYKITLHVPVVRYRCSRRVYRCAAVTTDDNHSHTGCRAVSVFVAVKIDGWQTGKFWFHWWNMRLV